MTLEDSEHHKALGNEYFSKKDYISALTAYTEAIVLNRSNAVLYSNRAATFLKLESWNNVVKDCDKGLELTESSRETNKRINVKLLWRKAIALRNLGDLKSAKVTITLALVLDPHSSELISENKTIDNLLESSHKRPKIEIIDEEMADPKSKENSNTKQSSNLVSIPIEYVEEIPRDFFKKEVENKPFKHESTKLQNLTTQNQKLGISDPSEPVEQKHDADNNDPVQTFNFNETRFPEKPSVQFLTSIKEMPAMEHEKYYSYILSLSAAHYQNIFKLTGIEPDILDIFLDSCIYALLKDAGTYKSQIINLLKTFKNLPRFDLTSMFADSKKVKRFQELFESKFGLKFKNYWS